MKSTELRNIYSNSEGKAIQQVSNICIHECQKSKQTQKAENVIGGWCILYFQELSGKPSWNNTLLGC